MLILSLRHALIVCLIINLTLTACVASTLQPATSVPVNTSFDSPIAPEIDAASQQNNTFDLTFEQAQEVAIFIEFIQAYNTGQPQAALALLAENVGVSDCDYQNIRVVTFQGKSRVAGWLQQRISDHDQLEISRIENENPDPSSGRHVIEVTYAFRTSMTLANLGFGDGITPALASKVIFTPEATLIQSFANGPYGGDPTLCRPGN